MEDKQKRLIETLNSKRPEDKAADVLHEKEELNVEKQPEIIRKIDKIEEKQPKLKPNKRILRKLIKKKKKREANKPENLEEILDLPMPPYISAANQNYESVNKMVREKDNKIVPIKTKPYAKINKNRRKRWARAIISAGLSLMLIDGYLGYLDVKSDIYNKPELAGRPHTQGNVWEGNGNDYQFDDNGQIVFDTMDDSERQTLTNKFCNNILKNANYYNLNIQKVNQIISLSLVPCNLTEQEDQNIFDRYILSILFSDNNNKTYAANYFANADFVCKEQTSKNIFEDFLNFLDNCFVCGCTNISEDGEAIQALVEDATFVGDYYTGFRQTGEKCYFIPIYFSNGEGVVYYTAASTIDGYGKQPMNELNKELQNITDDDSDKIIFLSTPFIKSNGLQSVMKVIDDMLYMGKTKTESVEKNK